MLMKQIELRNLKPCIYFNLIFFDNNNEVRLRDCLLI